LFNLWQSLVTDNVYKDNNEGSTRSDTISLIAREVGLANTAMTEENECKNSSQFSNVDYQLRQNFLNVVGQISFEYPRQKPSYIDVLSFFETRTSDSPKKDLTNYFGYFFLELLTSTPDGEEKLRKTLNELGHSYWFKDYVNLSELADGFARNGFSKIAVEVYALDYSRHRGMRGWGILGGKERHESVVKAVAINSDLFFRCLGDEVASILAIDTYTCGVVRHLCELFEELNDGTSLTSIWNEAYEVIRNRLEINGKVPGIFDLYICSPVENDLDRAFFKLLASRLCHPELRRRKGALLAISLLLARDSNDVPRKLAHSLLANVTNTAALDLLSVIHLYRESLDNDHAEEIANLFQDIEHFGLSVIASAIRENVDFSELSSLPSSKANYIYKPVREDLYEGILRSFSDYSEIKKIDAYAPQFTAGVVSRFDSEFKGQKEGLKENYIFRYKATRRVGEKASVVDHISWDDEIFHEAVNTMALGINASMWANGTWSENAKTKIIHAIIPNVQQKLGFELSRRPRPTKSLDRIIHRRIGDATPMVSDGIYEGWYRMAYFETALESEGGHSFEKDKRTVYFSTLARKDFWELYREDSLPFFQVDHPDWFKTNAYGKPPLINDVTVAFGRPSFSYSRINLLMPTHTIVEKFGLVGENWKNGLRMSNKHGTQLIFHWWWKDPRYSAFDSEVPSYLGSELIISPWLKSEIFKTSPFELKILTDSFSSITRSG
jgi:hypothetical protein